MILVFGIVIPSCAFYRPVDDIYSGIHDHPATRHERIAFSGFYLPSSRTASSMRDKNNYKIKLLTREFLDPDLTASPLFGYYSYLIFTDQSGTTYPMRKEAARAFMCQLEETDRSKAVGVNTKNMAVFYAPVKPGTTGKIKKHASGETLLMHYNYTFAEALMAKINNKNPNENLNENFTTGIIAHLTPLSLSDDDPIMLDRLEIINLSNMQPAQIGAVIRKLRQAVLTDDQISEIRIPSNKQQEILQGTGLETTPVYVDPVIEDFAAIFRLILASTKHLMPQVETAEASSIICK
ncbi:MAG: hypothetical protein H6936_12990 [Burkholderiales bacterium]|nr:hypothetical protein [Nitrosomonas sp.]MCP5275737.1 hypothetical protein [Burkholderiales bacterium]